MTLSSQEKVWLDMTSSLQVGILILSREVRLPLLSLTELDEKLSTTTILGIIVSKP